MPQLDISTYPSQVFWILVSFGILYMFVIRFVVPKMTSIFDTRWERIDHNFQRAEELHQEAQQLEMTCREVVQKAQEEAARILEKTRREMEQKRAELLVSLDKKYGELIEKSEVDLANKKKELMQDLPLIVEEMTTSLIKEGLSLKINEKAIKKAVQAVIES